MADNSRKAVAMARFLAIAHIVVGSFLIIFGIADCLTTIIDHNVYFWTGLGFFGIWIGPWMCVAGALGIPGSRYERSSSRNCFAGVFMGFSITSAVFGGIIIICYSIMISYAVKKYDYYYDSYNTFRYYRYQFSYETNMALSVIILILGIVEFVMGIWAAICLCVMKPCCGPAQGMQVTSAPMPIGAVGGPTPPQLVVAASPVRAGSPQEAGVEAQYGKYTLV